MTKKYLLFGSAQRRSRKITSWMNMYKKTSVQRLKWDLFPSRQTEVWARNDFFRKFRAVDAGADGTFDNNWRNVKALLHLPRNARAVFTPCNKDLLKIMLKIKKKVLKLTAKFQGQIHFCILVNSERNTHNIHSHLTAPQDGSKWGGIFSLPLGNTWRHPARCLTPWCVSRREISTPKVNVEGKLETSRRSIPLCEY